MGLTQATYASEQDFKSMLLGIVGLESVHVEHPGLVFRCIASYTCGRIAEHIQRGGGTWPSEPPTTTV